RADRPAAHRDRGDRRQPRGPAPRALPGPARGPRGGLRAAQPPQGTRRGAPGARMEGRAVDTGTNTARSAAPGPGAPAAAGRPLVVAIDGPSGSGKSSVSKEVARRFGLAYLDTGAMYRALTWWCLDRGVDLSDGGAVVEAARSFPLAQGTDPDRELVFVGGTDVGAEIRGARVTEAVSAVATTQAARAVLVARQQELIADSGRR